MFALLCLPLACARPLRRPGGWPDAGRLCASPASNGQAEQDKHAFKYSVSLFQTSEISLNGQVMPWKARSMLWKRICFVQKSRRRLAA